MEAASGGYADIVKLLIEHGANVNAKSSVGNTALTYACCGGYEDVVRILLDAGADVEHQNDNGHTPLMEAASCGHVGMFVCAYADMLVCVCIICQCVYVCMSICQYACVCMHVRKYVCKYACTYAHVHVGKPNSIWLESKNLVYSGGA